jgi:hypothetical protein
MRSKASEAKKVGGDEASLRCMPALLCFIAGLLRIAYLLASHARSVAKKQKLRLRRGKQEAKQASGEAFVLLLRKAMLLFFCFARLALFFCFARRRR